jgi:hypothetical protein
MTARKKEENEPLDDGDLERTIMVPLGSAATGRFRTFMHIQGSIDAITARFEAKDTRLISECLQLVRAQFSCHPETRRRVAGYSVVYNM